MTMEFKGAFWTFLIAASLIASVLCVYHKWQPKFETSVTAMLSSTPGEVYRLRELEKKVMDLETKLADRVGGGVIVEPRTSGESEYILPLMDSTGGVTYLHIPVYTGGVFLLQGTTTIPLSGTR